MGNSKRILSLDIAKAICIILVVIGHYLPDDSPEWYRMINKIIYSFHMPLFMFASGYIYIATKNEVSYGGFLLRKIKRLGIPYLSTSVIIISIKLLSQGHAYVQNPVTAMSYLKIFTGPEAGYFLWFVWALWWMFVIVPLFKGKTTMTLLFCIAVVAHYVSFPITELFCLREMATMFIWFMLGVVTQQYDKINKLITTQTYGGFAMATCLFVLCNALTISGMRGGG